MSTTPEPRRKRVYLAGPMSGIPFWNAPQFNHADIFLTRLGLEVVNPVTEDAKRHGGPLPHNGEWRLDPALYRQILDHDVRSVVPSCDAVFTIDGWTASNGAQAEVAQADALEIPVFHGHRSGAVWQVLNVEPWLTFLSRKSQPRKDLAP